MEPHQGPIQGQAGTKLPTEMAKLPRVPKGATIQKRPLPRRQQPASSKSRLIYVSTSTPFMAVVKRVRKQLERSPGASAPSTQRMSLKQRVDALNREEGTRLHDSEVLVLGTGKAIEKTLNVAAWFIEQKDCDVQIKTRTVGTVDDVMVDVGDDLEEQSRVRRVSCLEIAIRLK